MTTVKKSNEISHGNSQFFSKVAIAHISIRLMLANGPPIMDCDEVYNYWEPLHWILYQSGMQTWEYGYEFSLRTYAYLLPMAAISRLWQFLMENILSASILQLLSRVLDIDNYKIGEDAHKVLLFRLLRCSLALCTSLAELTFCYRLFSFNNGHRKHPSNHDYSAFQRTLQRISIWTLILLLSSAGMFHSSSAYLPSSTVMNLFLVSASHQLSVLSSFSELSDIHSLKLTDSEYEKQRFDVTELRKHCRRNIRWAILWGLIAVLATGWPFCALLFVPLGFISTFLVYWLEVRCTVDTISTQSRINGFAEVGKLLLETIVDATIIQSIVSYVDYKYYGRWTFPTWNILMYNAAGSGDELYGVEPASFYLKNLFLNWNLAAVFGLLSLPVWLMHNIIIRSRTYRELLCDPITLLHTLICLPMYVWLAVVVPRPHKEERFLFPIFPSLALGCAFFIQQILSVCTYVYGRWTLQGTEKTIKQPSNRALLLAGFLIISPILLLSVARSMALSMNYSAPIQLYGALYNRIVLSQESQSTLSYTEGDPLLVCTCGEWYRFPSSFHLPKHTQLAYLKSSFDGQLPQPFTKYGSKFESASLLKGKFNNLNQEELDRYVSLDDCSYIVELESSHDDNYIQKDPPECLVYMYTSKGEKQWRKVDSKPFLDAQKTSFFHRVLYVPFRHKVVIQAYSLYEASVRKR